jgi:outer membrane protein OmpA-like peptidoglycan-associated protein
LALSKRRATDALNELVRQGISRNVITAEGKGETEPFVQTGDGVKEQLNRRTEVLLTLGSIDAMVN